MKFNRHAVAHPMSGLLSTKMQQVMRMTIYLLIVCLHVSASAVSQKISLSLKNVPLSKVFQAIEQQSGYFFIYDGKALDINKRVDIQVKDVSLNHALEASLKGIPVTYSVFEKNIILRSAVETGAVKTVVFPADTIPRVTISGQVTDNKGTSLPGVTILVKGTRQGATTDASGQFLLNNIPANASLSVSSIGFLPQELPVAGKTALRIVLSPDNANINEVVVVGYGVQKKVNLTGAVETIKSEKIENKPVTSLTQALTGEAAGVTVVQRSSRPGAYDEFIRIRGVGTWGNSNPLILVDGVELSMDKVNPNDVQSVTVLKDAAAAAIYGSRAGNGVILITTKKASTNAKTTLNYAGNVGLQVPTRLPKYLSTYDFYEMKNRGALAEGKSPLKSAEQMEKFRTGQWNPDNNEANTNWLDEIIHNSTQQSHNVSVSAGSQKAAYLLSLGYLNQGSVVGDNTSFKRYNARLNTTTEITSWFKLDANLSFINGVTKEPVTGVTSMIRGAIESDPARPVRYSDGTWAQPGAAPNTVRMGTTNDFGNSSTNSNAINGMISPEIKFLRGFTLKGVAAFDKSIAKTDAFTKTLTYDAFTAAGNTVPSQNAAVAVSRNKKDDNWKQSLNMTYNATLDYEKNWASHYLKVLAGASRESFDTDNTNSSQSDLPSNDLDAIGAGTALAQITGNRVHAAIASYFGRVNYAYKEKYLFEANVRRDGSSKFKQGNQWGTFPSYSVGWRVSEEGFFKPLGKYVNNLKIRASYGHLGNNRIDDYKYLSTIKVDNKIGYSFGDNVVSNAYYEASMGNSMITWESLRSKNLGIDIGMFSNRLNITADIYDRKTQNILLDLPAPGTLGITPPTTNAGVVSNKGWEVTAGWKDQIGKVRYTVGFNLSDVKNKILDMQGLVPDRSTLTIRRVGDPIDAIYGWVADGIAVTQKQVEENAKTMIPFAGGSTDPNATAVQRRFGLGDVIIKDLNGDGKIDVDDKKVIGSQIPRYTFGINLGLEYKDFSFSCFLQGVGKVDGYLTYEATKPLFTPGNSYNPAQPDPNAKMPRMLATWEYNWVKYTSFWVENAAYVRLKNVQLGYSFRHWKQYGLSNMRVFFTGENMLTLTKYRGWDPESPAGMRGYTYPLTAVYSLGLNITL